MIKRIKIDNFKSLLNFEISEIGNFTCIVGLNGAGKSTLLQAIDFLAHLPTGRIDDWFKHRDWKNSDVLCRLPGSKRQRIHFEVDIQINDNVYRWEGDYNAHLMRCTAESLSLGEHQIYTVVENNLTLGGADGEPFALNRLQYIGSVLSVLAFSIDEYVSVVSEIRGMKSLDLLSPHLMRKRAADAVDVGYGGERLSALVHSLSAQDRMRLLDQIRLFYPNLSAIETKSLRAGWKHLGFRENYKSEDGKSSQLDTSAKHINDGLLRVLAFMAQAQKSSSLTLFDEVENGINPELAKALVDFLIGCQKQIIVTTHSPVILNMIPEDLARNCVYLLCKDRQGRTRSIRFFDLEETNRKLGILGPGEVYIDDSISELSLRVAESFERAAE